ncbi:MAG: DUF3037 domain-containing protein, partial [Caldilineaceae bacterium]|nr:DUF3037 domain-containing protein [Caldilineaceae bacterium]
MPCWPPLSRKFPQSGSVQKRALPAKTNIGPPTWPISSLGATTQIVLLRRQRRPMLHSYNYAYIRVVPRIEIGEFVNVGVILFCRTKRF